jgi:hypothetical protein
MFDLPPEEKRLQAEDLLMPAGMFAAGLIGSIMVLVLLWATPATIFAVNVANSAHIIW